MTASRPQAIVIGASAGALEALSVILPRLPEDFPIPLMIVVHIPPDKKSVLAELFQAKCRIDAVEAEDKERIRPRTAYFAPPNYHLLVEDCESLALSSDEPVLFSRPSIDVLFETAADAWGDGLIGIILTGANQDGARGLKAVTDAGGIAIVQDPGSAMAAAMPQAAIALCPDARILSLEAITEYLWRLS